MKIHSEQEMLAFGRDFAKKLLKANSNDIFRDRPRLTTGGRERVEKNAIELAGVIELIGDVGAGKTTFTRGLAEGLGIKEPITSPSFTISKTYAIPSGGRLIHYDFYRLSDPGLMVEDLEENLHNSDNIIVIEWGESIADLLPDDHIKLNISYNDDGTRNITPNFLEHIDKPN